MTEFKLLLANRFATVDAESRPAQSRKPGAFMADSDNPQLS
jgi:hypothetical protein